MPGSRAVVGLLLCCLTLAAPEPSVAAGVPAQGRAAFDQGQRRFLAGDYQEALASFKQGYLLTDDPAFLLNIAQCHRYLGQSKEALMMYRLYLKSTPEWSNPEARAVATKAVRELDSQVSAAPPSPLTPPAASSSSAITVPAPPAPLAQESTGPSRQATAAYPVLAATPELDANRVATRQNSADGAQSRARSLRLAGLLCGGAGLASLGVGFYYWTRASSLSDSASSATVYNQAYYDQGKRAETMQWIFYGVGAAAIATGSALYWYGRWRAAPRPTTVGFAPMVSAGVAGLAAHGAF